MHCILLLSGADGRLPSAEELRRRGFAVSEAVARPGEAAPQGAEPRPGVALAAEPRPPYGQGGGDR